MGSGVGLIGWLIVVVALIEGAKAADQYTVGDSFGWGVPPNTSTNFYAQWASNKTFNIGDTLVFNWTGNHTVSLASKEEYENCTKRGLMGFITSGLMITFNENGTFYYTCSVGTHCEQGQKLEVIVGDGISETNTTTTTDPAAGSAPKSLAVFGALITAFASTILVFFLSLFESVI